MKLYKKNLLRLFLFNNNILFNNVANNGNFC